MKRHGGDERSINLAEHSRNLMPMVCVDRTPDHPYPQIAHHHNRLWVLELDISLEPELFGDRTPFRPFPGFRTRQGAAPISTTTTERRTTERRTRGGGPARARSDPGQRGQVGARGFGSGECCVVCVSLLFLRFDLWCCFTEWVRMWVSLY
jgi:hypothetical protein